MATLLAVLQYRWIGEVSRAEHDRLRNGLQSSLLQLAQDFNREITSACVALRLENVSPDAAQREQDYVRRFHDLRESRHARLIRNFYLARPGEKSIALLRLDLNRGAFVPTEWPAEALPMRRRLEARWNDDRGRPPFFNTPEGSSALIELPVFLLSRETEPGRRPEPPRELEWMLLDMDVESIRTSLLPELIHRYLGNGTTLDYQVEVTLRDNPASVVFHSGPGDAPHLAKNADASVALFEIQFEQFFRRAIRSSNNAPKSGFKAGPGAGPRPRPIDPDRGRWLILARHRAGSVDSAVNQARYRNLAVTGAVFLLMLAAIGALLRYTRKAQQLASLQMDFVAGVSHELRTPLSVIRTAAHNLGGGIINNPKQLQRYSALIQDEADKLTAIIEQVLRFASTSSGRAKYAQEPIPLSTIVDAAVKACANQIDAARCTLEKNIGPDTPPVIGDSPALTHALQNLLTNAVKYGSDGGWIGLSAAPVTIDGATMVEIRVSDRGAGISTEELPHVFDPFYRGRRAIDDQIHGTGLGLSLVKRILEAQGGSVSVTSQPGQGTEFTLRIPAASMDQIDEFAHPSSRR